ncbi:MAG: antitoxin [Rickettsiaceae bacterium]|nr:MAG: antitoxin [Rickettsiaceae bacterium]
MLYTEDELKIRYQIVANVIASQRLSGIELDASTIEDLRRVARGELSTDEMRANILAKIKDGSF